MKTESELESPELKTGTVLDRCSISQLRGLLRLGVDPGEPLTSLPTEAGDTAKLARLLTEFLPEEARSGKVLLDTVSDPDSPLDVLRQIKELGKRLVDKAQTDSQRNAGRVLYHAAVAAAYAHYGENISEVPIRPRLPLYEDLATVLGGKPLGAVFRRAVERASEDEGGVGE